MFQEVLVELYFYTMEITTVPDVAARMKIVQDVLSTNSGRLHMYAFVGGVSDLPCGVKDCIGTLVAHRGEIVCSENPEVHHGAYAVTQNEILFRCAHYFGLGLENQSQLPTIEENSPRGRKRCSLDLPRPKEKDPKRSYPDAY